MRLLDKILDIRKDINSLDIRIKELELSSTSPKAQVITGMPFGGGERKNPMDENLEKKDKLKEKRNKLERKLNTKWEEITQLFNARGVTEVQGCVMMLRFYKGYAWKRVVSEMQVLYPNSAWNEQKLFRIYRMVIGKIYKH